MRQVFTILWDSYRLLAAKKLFWIALFLTVLIALMYASVGFTPEGISMLFGAYEIKNDIIVEGSMFADYFYMMIFTDYLVPWWLGLFALVLALISVCPVFPDFLKTGSIDIAISKPMSRGTLFLVKYLGSLFFVGIQVLVFCVIVFIAHKVRLDVWNFEIFWAVLLLTFVFSLIYSVAVLVAVLTKSTLFSLLVALLAWAVTLSMQWTESLMYKATYVLPAAGISIDVETGGTNISNQKLDANADMERFYDIVKKVCIPLPKTRDATYLLKKKVSVRGKDMTMMSAFLEDQPSAGELREAKAMEAYDNRHSIAYIVGSSLGFEVFILGIACWVFVRKDF
jgi:ABC-type transport system involved in multi-copper enzyme maturation permease subunit